MSRGGGRSAEGLGVTTHEGIREARPCNRGTFAVEHLVRAAPRGNFTRGCLLVSPYRFLGLVSVIHSGAHFRFTGLWVRQRNPVIDAVQKVIDATR